MLSRADGATEHRFLIRRPASTLLTGSNENINGLLRQFMLNEAGLSKASQEYLNNVVDLMNARPRQTFGWKTPNQTLEEEIAQFNLE
uniref:hypothetical protein n=1 Tax=Xanthomonas albilineans TaxID=29447 RepID=UPI001E3A6B80|nr:hypothetical protein [Xanthomonas albilineans]